MQAGQDARRNMAATFVVCCLTGTVAGYHTLSSTFMRPDELPDATARRLPKYPFAPATLLSRLVVDRRPSGQGLRPPPPVYALYRAARSE